MRETTLNTTGKRKNSNMKRGKGTPRKNEKKRKERNNKKHVKKEKYPVEWWDIECKEVVKYRKTKFKEFKRTGTMDSYKEDKNAKKEARKVIREKK